MSKPTEIKLTASIPGHTVPGLRKGTTHTVQEVDSEGDVYVWSGNTLVKLWKDEYEVIR